MTEGVEYEEEKQNESLEGSSEEKKCQEIVKKV